MAKVKVLHDQDLAAGHGEVWLPGALDVKYHKAAGILWLLPPAAL